MCLAGRKRWQWEVLECGFRYVDTVVLHSQENPICANEAH